MKQIEKILFPIDFASHFDTLIPWVKGFAEKFGAKVYVLFVAQDLSHYSTFYVPHGNIDTFQQEALDAARKRMAGAAQELAHEFPQMETRVEVGKAADKILEVAHKEKIDLIIMGAHGRKGVERAIFGSVADKVVQGAPCPVMTIHP
jgi:nucleotide-binding universal stress UspA family protein